MTKNMTFQQHDAFMNIIAGCKPTHIVHTLEDRPHTPSPCKGLYRLYVIWYEMFIVFGICMALLNMHSFPYIERGGKLCRIMSMI